MRELKLLGTVTLVALVATACGGGDDRSAPSSTAADATTTVDYQPTIDPADFVDSVDNPYLPLEPGTTRVYEGESDGDHESNTVAVTRDTKEILGVRCTVVRDTVSVDGQVTEDTYDWFAQDRDGNVWYFGEDSKEYDNGKPVSTKGSWEAGVAGALPGIVMPARPRVGDPYRQEYLAGEAEDMGQIVRLGEIVSVASGTYRDVLVTKDWTPLEPGIVEHKYYAPGVGVVLEETVRGGSGRVELIEISDEG